MNLQVSCFTLRVNNYYKLYAKIIGSNNSEIKPLIISKLTTKKRPQSPYIWAMGTPNKFECVEKKKRKFSEFELNFHLFHGNFTVGPLIFFHNFVKLYSLFIIILMFVL